jgi:hypothetical protein
MPPIRINYYGLMPMTRFAYWVTFAAAASFALSALLIAGVMGFMPPLDTMWSLQHHRPGPGIEVWIHNYVYWIIVVCLIAQVIDTFCTMRQFAKKEKEQRALLDEWLREEDAGGADLSDPRFRAGAGARRRPPETNIH